MAPAKNGIIAHEFAPPRCALIKPPPVVDPAAKPPGAAVPAWPSAAVTRAACPRAGSAGRRGPTRRHGVRPRSVAQRRLSTPVRELRRRKRRPARSLDEMLDDSERPLALVGDDAGPEDESLRSELRRSIEQALLILPADQRLAVVLCDVEGLSYDEVAEVMRSSLGTVKSRVSRGRAKMRQLLREAREPLPRGPRQEE